MGIEKEINSGRKFIILARHGKLNTKPDSPIYNRDRLMKPQDIVHLSPQGREQMRELGNLIKEKGFKPVRLLVSPETRAQESAEELNQSLGVGRIITDERLDEILGPGAYLEGYQMKDLMMIKANPELTAELKAKYPYEDRADLIKRMKAVFWEEVKKLKAGETTIFVSHGDPIAYLTNELIHRLQGESPQSPHWGMGRRSVEGGVAQPRIKKTPASALGKSSFSQIVSAHSELRGKMYCSQGDALVVVIDSENRVLTLDLLKSVQDEIHR